MFGGKALKEALGGEGAGSRGRAGGGNRFCRSTVKTLWVAAVALWCGTPECVRPWGNAGAPGWMRQATSVCMFAVHRTRLRSCSCDTLCMS